MMPTDLRIDLHTHPKIAKRTPFHPRDTDRSVAAARRRGLTGLALTEHAHAVGYWATLDRLARSYPSRRGRFIAEGVALYPGMELTLAEGVDLVLIAPVDELRRLDGAFDAPLTAGHHPSALEAVAVFDRVKIEAIRILAHPTRPDKPADRLPDPILRSLAHAVEINARFARFDDINGARALAERLSLPLVGASDAHTWPQIAAASTSVYENDDSFDALRAAILTGRCRPIVHDNAERLVAVGKRFKKRLKARRERLAPLSESLPSTLVGEPAP